MSPRMVTQRVSVKASRFAVPPKRAQLTEKPAHCHGYCQRLTRNTGWRLTTYDDAEFRFLAIAARE